MRVDFSLHRLPQDQAFHWTGTTARATPKSCPQATHTSFGQSSSPDWLAGLTGPAALFQFDAVHLHTGTNDYGGGHQHGSNELSVALPGRYASLTGTGWRQGRRCLRTEGKQTLEVGSFPAYNSLPCEGWPG